MDEKKGSPRTRRFEVWCCYCPTRIALQTEEEGEDDARGIDAHTPQYDLESRYPCPVCGHALVDTDYLFGLGHVPYDAHGGPTIPERHAAWLKEGASKFAVSDSLYEGPDLDWAPRAELAEALIKRLRNAKKGIELSPVTREYDAALRALLGEP